MALKDCVAACQYDAIHVRDKDGFAVVKDHNCVSCGACVSKCPKKLIHRIPKSAKVYVACSNPAAAKVVTSYCKNGCIACGRCVKACKDGAISLKDNRLAVINYDDCTSCGDCAEVCPTKVIKVKE
jgi:NAD-dependent dihydropyrimidine dehydrogenase PreA subunit